MTVAALPRPMLPELDAYLARIVARGAEPRPLVELNCRLMTTGSIRMGHGTYQQEITFGPLMTGRIVSAGRLLGVA
jgi:hypothetical protein